MHLKNGSDLTMEIAFLSDIVIICGLAVVIVYLCKHIKVPTIIAFLITGVLAGAAHLRAGTLSPPGRDTG